MIRAATVADAEGIARAHVAAWAETYVDAPPEVLAVWTVERRTEQWTSILGSPAGRCVAVVEVQGMVHGFAAWGPTRDQELWARGLQGEMQMLYLLRAVQRRGFGRGLMRRAASDLCERGHTGVHVWVGQTNWRARAFYERLGGRLLDVTKDEVLAGLTIRDVAYAWAPLATASTAWDTIGVGSSQ